MLLFNFEGACPPRKAKEKTERTLRWGCSSAGRAPALQAGGQGFDSPHLHQSASRQQNSGKTGTVWRDKGNSERTAPSLRSVAQVARARA